MAESGIYEIVNLVNGKRYVGSAVNIRQRWREHHSLLNRENHHSPHLQNAWRKYGAKAFAFRVIATCCVENLLFAEQSEIDREWPAYNVCPTAGSSLGRTHSNETRAKIAAKKVGLKLPPRSEEYRAAVSERWKGKQKSPKHMAALQEGRLRQKRTPEQLAAVGASLKRAYAEGRKSRSRPPEYRAKIAETLRERGKDPAVRERMRAQAKSAWASLSEDERKARMEKVRAAKRRTAISE